MTNAGLWDVGGKKILFVAQSRGSLEVLEPLARELLRRGRDVEILTAGSSTETGMGDLASRRIESSSQHDLAESLQTAGLLIAGVTGSHSVEAQLCALARLRNIRSIGILDNIDNLSARLPGDKAAFPDLLVLSGGLSKAYFDQEPIVWLMSRQRFLQVDNLRRASAARRRAEFERIGRSDMLHRIFAFRDLYVPSRFDRAKLVADVVSGKDKLVIFYAQTIPPGSPYWQSYGHGEAELAEIYAGSLIVASKALATLRRFAQVCPLVRPHPGDNTDTSFMMAKAFGCLYLPAESGHSLDLAMAAGHAVTSASSMIDQGPFHGVRTAALLFEQPGPFPYESLAEGSVCSAYRLEDTQETLRHLVADGALADAQWSLRLNKGLRPADIKLIADGIFEALVQYCSKLTTASQKTRA